MTMIHDENPAQKILKELGDVSRLDVTNINVLTAVYIRPNSKKIEGTDKRLWVPDSVPLEDRYQGKVGLIVKTGPLAFDPTASRWGFDRQRFDLGDWVVFRPSDGWSITINGVLCRMLEDNLIKGRIPRPDMAW